MGRENDPLLAAAGILISCMMEAGGGLRRQLWAKSRAGQGRPGEGEGGRTAAKHCSSGGATRFAASSVIRGLWERCMTVITSQRHRRSRRDSRGACSNLDTAWGASVTVTGPQMKVSRWAQRKARQVVCSSCGGGLDAASSMRGTSVGAGPARSHHDTSDSQHCKLLQDRLPRAVAVASIFFF